MPLDYILPVKQTASTNRNGVNKQNTRHTLSHTHTHTHTHTHAHQTFRHWKGLVSMKINDTCPFLKQPHLFYQPLHFYRKNLNPPFSENFGNSTNPSPFIERDGGSN